jgi:hypothetical protein
MLPFSVFDDEAIVIRWTTVLPNGCESGFWFGFKRYQKKVLKNRLVLIRRPWYALSGS